MSDISVSSKRFRSIGLITIVAVYFLILVGGIVRSTGSGMGCPDWPKCFGTWVPPTNINQLPDNYLSVYKNQRIEKNKKLAVLLNKLGFTQLSTDIFSHPSQYIETEFNATKTWIEYLNRLVGVLIGIFVFLTLVFSFPFFNKDRKIFYLSLLSFILVGFQGWLGSLVVSTNLLPEMITVHMALALILVAVLIYAVARSQKSKFTLIEHAPSRWVYFVLYTSLVFSFIQILLGTQVRELIDQIAAELNYLARETWVDKLGISFYIHRTFSTIILLVNVYLCRQIYRLHNAQLKKWANVLIILIVAEILVGIVLSYLALPALFQPIHLLLATLIFGLQFFILISCYYATHKRVLKLAIQ
ncbi:MAG: COX15/CtaA family protein [Bacteroidota bacterium]|nr:COX15/CtaA family protein [Bacteroidota bacterium]